LLLFPNHQPPTGLTPPAAAFFKARIEGEREMFLEIPHFFGGKIHEHLENQG